ncbi:glycerol-3-phosphate responsive antiterminator [Carboxydothermus pertinax]|uniref:Transcriptional regulator n=1 Tax=Carboxydothermus pertinax TaxID=870242 RepID=A0A1L8CSJ0_9THEO|nr:glycerol-3-phosphate responsive antiterminator [Carboxydothermus pertinax]GAV21890.1 transcriptional regulator [Carboxydothermus pertinax]
MLIDLINQQKVIPAIRTPVDFREVLTIPSVKIMFLLFGDINSLGDYLRHARSSGKKLIVHFDLIEGLGKDEAAVKYLVKAGVEGIITTKTSIARQAKKEGIIAIQRLFIIDSEAVRSGLKQLNESKPHGVEILPATVPAKIVQEIKEASRLPVIGGGLIQGEEDLKEALSKGFSAVSTNKTALWYLNGVI